RGKSRPHTQAEKPSEPALHERPSSASDCRDQTIPSGYLYARARERFRVKRGVDDIGRAPSQGHGGSGARFVRRGPCVTALSDRTRSPSSANHSHAQPLLVPPLGLEPRTFGLKVRCSTN